MAGKGNITRATAARVSKAIAHEYSVVSAFPYGYRNREDITNFSDLKGEGAGVLVVGSQNMLINTSGRAQVRQGYAIDGAELLYINTTAISSNQVTVDSTLPLTTGTYAKVFFTGSSITGLTSGSYYYLIVVDSTHIKFATSNTDAIAGTPITISGTPTGSSLSWQKSGISAGINASFDWNSKGNSEIHMRTGFKTTGNNDGRLQYRWKDANGNVFWSDLLTGLSTVAYNFTTFWNTTELIRTCLFVNGTSNIYEWAGAFDTVVSVTNNTITVSNPIGTTGFYNTANLVITIRGVDYTYTGISGSTFTGVMTDPTSGSHTVYAGDIAVQKIVTTANSDITTLPDDFANGLISTLNNQLFVGALTSPVVYVSKTSNYKDFSMASPRIPSDGATATLDDNITAFVPQENNMYISAGKNFWYNTSFVQSSTYNGSTALLTEAFTVQLLKTNPQQGAQSQALASKIQNYITMVSFEPVLNTLGRLENILGTPQTKNISDTIKLDFDIYDFTGGALYYWRWYLLVSIPTLGIIRMFNFKTEAWEAPQTIPVTRFYTVNGNLYGHSSLTSESYQLFTGYSDRATTLSPGAAYLATANFSYQNFGSRTNYKTQNKFYIEGYISANTTVNCVINYEQDGNLTQQTFTVLGDDVTIAPPSNGSNYLGSNYLGNQGLGTVTSSSLTGLPPKFRVVKTFPRFDFFECQFSFSILGVDQNFQLLAFGSDAQLSATLNAAIEE